MAQGTDNRPEFPNPDRPLYTPDEDAQRQVVARIKQARKGRRVHTEKEPEGGAIVSSVHLVQRRGLPMGEHPRVGRMVLADEWGIGHTTADKLAAHPEMLDPWQVRQLCDLCGVTLEWLRGWEDVNAYGRYKTAETIAAMYGHLSNEDRQLVSDLLARLLGADALDAIENEQWMNDNREWLERNPERVKELYGTMQGTMQSARDSMREATQTAIETMRANNGLVHQAMREAIEPATRAAAEHIQDVARAIKDRYTTDEWELIESTADRLKAQGVDAGRMTPDELLARARGDSVED